MIRGYKQQVVLDTPSENCSVIKATKDGRTFLMHEFESINDSDEFSFRIRKKLSNCAHLVPLV
jgi:hypothetical protein